MIAFIRLVAVLLLSTTALAMQQPPQTAFSHYQCPIQSCNTLFNDCLACFNHLMHDHQGIRYQCAHCAKFSSTSIVELLNHRSHCSIKQNPPITPPVAHGCHDPDYYQVSATLWQGACYSGPTRDAQISDLLHKLLVSMVLNQTTQQQDPQLATSHQAPTQQPQTPTEMFRAPSPDAIDWQALTEVLEKDGYCGHTNDIIDPLLQTTQISKPAPAIFNAPVAQAIKFTQITPEPSAIRSTPIPSHSPLNAYHGYTIIPVKYIKNAAQQYNCPVTHCGKIFQRIRLFDDHFKKDHPTSLIGCSDCSDFVTTSLFGLTCHSNHCKGRP